MGDLAPRRPTLRGVLHMAPEGAAEAERGRSRVPELACHAPHAPEPLRDVPALEACQVQEGQVCNQEEVQVQVQVQQQVVFHNLHPDLFRYLKIKWPQSTV